VVVIHLTQMARTKERGLDKNFEMIQRAWEQSFGGPTIDFSSQALNLGGPLVLGVDPGGAAILRVGDNTDAADLTIARMGGIRATPTAGDTIHVDYILSNDAPAAFEYARMTLTAESVGDGTETGSWLFEIARAGALEVALKMSPTEIVVNESGTDRNFRIETLVGTDTFTIDGTTGQIGIGATPVSQTGVLLNPPAQTIPGNNDYYRTWVRTTGALTATGTHTLVAGARFDEPKIVLDGGTVATTATVYIEGAATEGALDYALFVDDGVSRFDDNISMLAGKNIVSSASVYNYLTVDDGTGNLNGKSRGSISFYIDSDNNSAAMTFQVIKDTSTLLLEIHEANGMKIAMDLDHDGTNVGFYGATPVAQPTGVAVSAAAIHAALVNLGLITA
jgi:hypothetical protein